MKLIVGLGNPGLSYSKTRHNVGFLTIDEIAKTYLVKLNKVKGKAQIGDFNHRGEKIILAKPQTFMNNSGESVRDLMAYYDLAIEDLIVIYDDIDIPFGSLRIKSKGSSGSHNGMRSIMKYIKDEGFPRIRISIGQKPSYMNLADFVLSKFTNKEEKTIKNEISAAAKAAILLVEEGPEAAMNTYNGLDFNE